MTSRYVLRISHPASSHGIPVLVDTLTGRAYGAADRLPGLKRVTLNVRATRQRTRIVETRLNRIETTDVGWVEVDDGEPVTGAEYARDLWPVREGADPYAHLLGDYAAADDAHNEMVRSFLATAL